MHFLIERDILIEAIQDVLKAVASKTPIPILTGIKIVATEEGVTLTGSDSDISIERFIPAEEDDEVHIELKRLGSLVLQAKFFAEIVKKLPKDMVEIETNEHFGTLIRSGSAQFNLNGFDPEEYPRLPQIEEENVFKISSDLLKQMIRQTVFAVSTQETRPVLTGVNWVVEAGQLSCIATDSHRLAMRTAQIESLSPDLTFHNVVIPGKSLNELNKIIEDTTDLLEIVVTENQILFRAKNLLFFSRLLDGNYPETTRLIPQESQTTIKVKTKDFLQTVDRASLLAREGQNNVIKLIASQDKILEISSNSPEIGKVVERLQAQEVEGEELKISFSAKYMMDALKAIDDDEIEIRFTGPMRPFVLHAMENQAVLQLILPVRTF
ncbi:DNA polymerase III subunit beta [Massilibacterium senegalense]|uniref:DNA polymerase III subunit beta n=1 Tax=Massilibacterium senegalense TaxID=1632858 RepID=UPI0007867EB1|nr:DNA polymerase III subunit beta [Massilibacterium senegalense]